VRDNTERLRPPRFLWVPFELGRPFGAPDAPDFQMRVLRATLALLERTDGPPLLEDFPDDAPAAVDDSGEGWVCPINLPPPPVDSVSDLEDAVRDEIARLDPWYTLACETRGRTAFGVSAMSLESIVGFLAAYQAGGETAENPASDRPLAETLRLACADLRCWYLEAAAARPGGDSRTLADWFWGETAAARLLMALYPVCTASEDADVRHFGESQLVPRAQRHRLG